MKRPRTPKAQPKTAQVAKPRKTCSQRVATAIDAVLVTGSLKGEKGGPIVAETIATWREFIAANRPTQTRFLSAVVELLEAAQADARS
jgi:hypothetical protein